MAKSRTNRSQLIKQLDLATSPIYLVASDRRIVYANRAACQWTGLDQESLTALTCRYHSGIDLPPSQQLAAGLCPAPDAFEGQIVHGAVAAHGTAKKIRQRKAVFFPLGTIPIAAGWPGSNQPDGGVLVLVADPPAMDSWHAALPPEASSKAVFDDESTRSLHAAITQMQYEHSCRLNLDLILGISDRSIRARRQIDLACQVSSNLVICGPPHSGRQQVAELIHFAKGPPLVGPLIPINAAVSDAETLQQTIKRLYRNSKQHSDEPLGRLLLLNLDKMSETAQSELLGFLKLPDFQLPVIATCQWTSEESIMPALWQQLSTVAIELPPLQERIQDLPYLAQAAVEELNALGERQRSGIAPSAMQAMMEYPWPGEWRELQQVVKTGFEQSNKSPIELNDLPANFRLAVRSLNDRPPEQKTTIDLDDFLSQVELELIRRALTQAGGNKSRAARMLRISRPRLLRRLQSDSEARSEIGDPLADHPQAKHPPAACDDANRNHAHHDETERDESKGDANERDDPNANQS